MSYAKSLLTPLPDRDCFSCGIPNNWCLCHEWVTVPASVPTQKIAEYAMGKLNEFVQNGKSICRSLVLQNIIGIVMTQAETSVFPTYRIEFSVVAPRSIIFRAFVTETVNGYWMTIILGT